MSRSQYTRLPTTEKPDSPTTYTFSESPYNYPPSPSSASSQNTSRTSSVDSNSTYNSNSNFNFNGNFDLESRPRRRRTSPTPAFDSDPRFRVEKPSPWARAALIGFMLFMFYLAFRMRRALWLIVLEGEGFMESDPDSWGM